jgi:hypothetical protein
MNSQPILAQSETATVTALVALYKTLSGVVCSI